MAFLWTANKAASTVYDYDRNNNNYLHRLHRYKAVIKDDKNIAAVQKFMWDTFWLRYDMRLARSVSTILIPTIGFAVATTINPAIGVGVGAATLVGSCLAPGIFATTLAVTIAACRVGMTYRSNELIITKISD